MPSLTFTYSFINLFYKKNIQKAPFLLSGTLPGNLDAAVKDTYTYLSASWCFLLVLCTLT